MVKWKSNRQDVALALAKNEPNSPNWCQIFAVTPLAMIIKLSGGINIGPPFVNFIFVAMPTSS